MKKRRKGNLLQRMMAVFLSAVLAAGTVAGAGPMAVFAAENTQISDSVSGNDMSETEQAVKMKAAAKMTAAANAVSDFTALKQQIESASSELEIRLAAGTISMTETISVPQGSTVTLLADGGDCSLQRASGFAGEMFSVNGTLKLGNAEDGSGKLILDGGAVWGGNANAILGRGTANSGASAGSSLLIGKENSEIYLYPSALLRNNDCGENAYGGAVTLYEQGAKLYLYGGSIVDNASSNGGGAVKTYEGASVIMTGGEISGNYAGTHGGAFQIYSGKPYAQGDWARSVCEISGGTIQKNLCNRYGGGITFGDSDTVLSLAGDIVVSGNTRGEETNNLHIGEKNNKITIGALSDSAQIGVTMKAGTGVFSNSCDTDRKSCFFSDKPDYKVVSGEGNALSLAEAQTDDNIASGTDWVLDGDGVLTISSDTGMDYWIVSDKGAYKSEVKQVKLRDGVTKIPDKAFSECGNLAGIEIPSSVTSIGESAFYKCSSLESIKIPAGVERIENQTFEGCSKLTNITIPSSVTSIGEYAFRGCSKLADIELPSSVSSIMFAAFGACSSLTSIEIPSNVTSIEGSVFSGCSSLIDITIPDGVTSIGSSAFSGCSGLKSITIPSSVTSIGKSAFNGCSSLTNIEIPSKVTRIEDNTFLGCSSLTGVVITESVTGIGSSAFWDCSNLTDIVIPSGVKSIGGSAFAYCSKLANVTMQGETPPEIGTGVFSECNSFQEYRSITVPSGCTAIYKEKWSEWKDYIKEGAPVHRHYLTQVPAKDATCTSEGNHAYYTCSGCDKWFEDEAGRLEITDKDSVSIPRSNHDYHMTVWKSDGTSHWHACRNCGAKTDEASHTFGDWQETKPATESEDGSREKSCSVCVYKETETIPKTGGTSTDSGKIETDKEQGDNTPDTDFGSSKDELISAVLTSEEQSLVAAGTDIKIVLDIDNIDATVNQSDKQAVTDNAGEYEVGQYLDINLYKIIGADRTKISHTNGKIRIVLTIPDSLQNTDSTKTRSYAVVRVHDGAAELLADTDNDEATITIETDLFSTYALVYKDTAKTGDQNPDDGGSGDSGNTGGSGNSGDSGNIGGSGNSTDNDSRTAGTEKDNEPKTGDAAPVEIYATLAMIAGFSYLILLFGNGKRGMTEQKKEELTAALVAWGRKGGKLRRAAALTIIFLILVYYHSIGKKISVDWKEVYGE